MLNFRTYSLLGLLKKPICARILTNMKKDLHPKTRKVVFHDAAANFMLLADSTLDSKELIKYTDGNEYPVIRIEISSASHPFFTGQEKVLDTTGRVDRFKKRFAAAKQA